MKKIIVLTIAAFALSACVSHNWREGERLNWRCAGDKEFSLRHVAGAVEVYASGQTHRLMPVDRNSYSNGAVTYANNRGRGTLTGVYNGPFENCRRTGMWPRLF